MTREPAGSSPDPSPWGVALLSRVAATAALCTTLLLVGLLAPVGAAVPPPPPSAPVRSTLLAGLAEGTAASEASVAAAPVTRTSVPVRAPFAFSLVGLQLPPDAVAEVRTSVDGETWTPWYAAPPALDEGPDPGSAEARAAVDRRVPALPVWVGEARHVQTRVTGAGTTDVDVWLVDSAGLSRSVAEQAVDAVRAAWSGTPRPALAQVDTPAIVSREDWGADESLEEEPPAVAPRARAGFVHHTAGGNDYEPEDVPAILRGIQEFHVVGNGWADIGYNFLVDRYGTLWEGRAGGIEQAVVGAHAGGFNTGTFGVSVIGDFSGAEAPAPAVDALADLLAWKFDVHAIDVLDEVTLTSGGSTRYAEGEKVTLPTLSGHLDVSATTCPAALYELLPAVREEVADRQGPVVVTPVADPPVVEATEDGPLDGPVTLSARLRPAGAWTLTVRDPDGEVVATDAGSGTLASTTWEPTGRRLGEHTFAVAADGRRPAVGRVRVEHPAITDATAEPTAVRTEDDGDLDEPVRFSAELWAGASWTVTVTDPEGEEVATEEGTGSELEAVWDGPAPLPGTYTWTVEAGDAPPAAGTIGVDTGVLARVGTAPDPAEASVELSRAAFPAPDSAARAVIARGDVFADALAGGPLAGSEGPVLLTGSGGLADVVVEELTRVLPAGSPVYVLGGETALGPAVVEELAATWDVTRLAGPERTATAAAVADAVLARTGATTAMLARAGPDDALPWADALAGGAWGAAEGVPVLLTDSDRLSTPAAELLLDRRVTDTIVLGGTAAVSDEVTRELTSSRRVAGDDRVGTAVAAAVELWGRTDGADGDRVVLADAYQDDAWTLALAATPLAARNVAPLLVTGEETLPAATVDYLAGLGYGDDRQASGWVLGSTDHVGDVPVETARELLTGG